MPAENVGYGTGRQLRALVVAYTEYPWDSRVRREAETLARDGYKVHMVSLKPRVGGSPSRIRGVDLSELPLTIRRGGRLSYVYQYTAFFLMSLTTLVRLQLRHRFDLVHIHSLPDFQVFCALPLKLRGIPILLDLHESMPELLRARFHLSETATVVRLSAWLQVFSCRFADHVIVACDGIRDVLIQRGVPATRVTSVYNAVEEPAIHPNAIEVRHRFRLPDARFIVHAGGINPERDLETLLKAVAILPSNERMHLLIAGEGVQPYVQSLQTLSARLGIAERVHFVGRLPVEDARALMAISDVGVVTLESNPHTELSWPIRVAEFVHLMKPLVVPRLRFMVETLQDSAHFYEPGNASSLAQQIEKVLSDSAGSASKVVQAETVCRPYEWPHMRKAMLGICQTMVSDRATD